MTDIARLGLAAETQPIKDAAKDLDRLSQSAKSAGTAADKFSASSSKMGAGLKGAASGAASTRAGLTAAASGMTGLGKSSLMTSTALGTVNGLLGTTAGGLNRVSAAASGATGQLDAHVQAWKRVNSEMVKMPAAANGATSALNRLGAAASDNINKMQATPGNIAAQFQDIGVTAAGGMNPMLIALQQGTQLGAAMSGGLKNLGLAVMQLLSPVNLLAIGLTAGVALLIQWGIESFNASEKALDLNDAVSTLGSLQNSLGDVFDLTTGKIADNTEVVRVNTLATILNAQAKAEALKAETQGILDRAAAGKRPNMGLFASGFGFFMSGPEQMQQAKNLRALQKFTKEYLDGTVKAEEAMKRANSLDLRGTGFNSQQLRDAIQGATNAIALNEMAERALKSMETGTLDPSFIEPRKTRESRGKSDAEKLVDVFTGAQADVAVENTRRLAAGLDVTNEAAATMEQRTKLLNEIQSKGIPITDAIRSKVEQLAAAYGAAKAAADNAETMNKIITGSKEDIAALQTQIDMVGKYGRELAFAAAMADMLAKARAGGMSEASIGAAMPIFENRAGAIADKTAELQRKRFMEDLVQDAEMLNLQLGRERGELGLTGAALIAYRYETEKLVAAKRAHIDLSPEELEAIRQAGILYGEQADAIAKASQALEDNKATVRGVFDAVAESITKGTNLWNALADTFDRVVDRMVSRLLDDLMDAIFQVNNAVGGGGGFFGSLLGLAGSIGGGGGLNVSGGPITGIDASGSIGGIPGFAKGGVFTNGIVDSPTMFKFANGGKFGVMGEAGAEAVMPLKRGADGSLGVQVHGGSNDNAPSFTFDLRGAVVTQDILDQMNQIASQQANVAVNQNNVRQQRQSQRALGKK